VPCQNFRVGTEGDGLGQHNLPWGGGGLETREGESHRIIISCQDLSLSECLDEADVGSLSKLQGGSEGNGLWDSMILPRGKCLGKTRERGATE